MRMKILGYSGLHSSVLFKKTNFPDLDSRFYRIAQGADSAAALIVDNKIIASAAEERFTREKATGSFPVNAIKYCLQCAGLELNQIDYIAHGFNYEKYKDEYTNDDYKMKLFEEVYSREAQLALLREYLQWSKNSEKDFIQVPHHLAHAASCFYLSGFKNALVLIADGMGEKENITIALGENNSIKILAQIPEIHSIGILYSVFTMFLGFEFNSDEYKVMGLAPYGNPGKYYNLIMNMVELQADGKFTIPILYKNTTAYEKATYAGTLDEIAKVLGPARNKNDEITEHYQDVAAAIQCVLQVVLMHVLRYYKLTTGAENLAMAGGVALNCTANSYIRKSRLFKNIFIQPVAGDDGTALGSAIYTYYNKNPQPKAFSKFSMPYYGPSYGNDDVAKLLSQVERKYNFVFLDNFTSICERVVEKIAHGSIVGWFQGKMELGARALGNRSILADPRNPEMKDILNARIKLREGFRPFAPAVLAEYASVVFDVEESKLEDYMYMVLTAQVKENYLNKLPSITHVDKSARLQTVFQESNPRFWQLINAFRELTQVPVLINTSFNIKGQPIVCSVNDALETMDLASLDALVIGNYLITRKGD